MGDVVVTWGILMLTAIAAACLSVAWCLWGIYVALRVDARGRSEARSVHHDHSRGSPGGARSIRVPLDHRPHYRMEA